MHWKTKAAIQNGISVLPSALSYSVYYLMQRHFGGLKSLSPIECLTAGLDTWTRIVAQGSEPSDKTFFEVGTGRTPDVPLAYWLMGARRTITVDLNPYLKDELVRESLEYIVANQGEITSLFGRWLRRDRMEALLALHKSGQFSLARFLELCSIEYVAPGDASRTGLPAGSVDFHTSYTVLEHIPAEVLAAILHEGNRIIADQGLFVHMIDYSDHFSHSDPTISAINFLQYSDAEWAGYAANRYMYTNRLRHDDIMSLFETAGHRILAVTAMVDERSRALLASSDLRLDQRFATRPHDILAIRGSWIVSQKSRPAQRRDAPL